MIKIEISSAIEEDAETTARRLRIVFGFVFVLATFVAGLEVTAATRASEPPGSRDSESAQSIIVVTNTNDNGPGSLREALVLANNGDMIDVTGISGTILLTSGELQVSHAVTIYGPGFESLTVDGNATFRVFYIDGSQTVTIRGMTIANGHGDYGGGILSANAALTVSNCTVTANRAEHGGGGICNSGSHGHAMLTVINCTFIGNSAYDGGAISSRAWLGSAVLTVNNCTINGNSAEFGGGISIGGGFEGGSIGWVSNSTISGNLAEYGGGMSSEAGGNTWVTLTITNGTLSNNSADSGGGILNKGGARLALGNTIFNAGASGENISNNGGAVTSFGYSMSSDDGGGVLTGPGDQIDIDPMLGPLQDNGGTTFTHALLPGSPAIDAGDPTFTAPPFFDQRGPGFDRVVNGRVDIGSFEVQSHSPTPTPTATATATAIPTATPTVTPRISPTPRPRPTSAPRL